LVNPDIDNYKRPYLLPYRQEHPSDKTLTIFFELPNKQKNLVFFVWVNDEQYPHNTHKNHGEDPCMKEFKRLQDSNLLEHYSEEFHEGKFTIDPKQGAPKFLKFEKYRCSVHANILYDGTTHYALAIATPNNPHDLFDHYNLFIKKIREHFIAQKKPFEFRVFAGDTQFENLLQQNINSADWKREASQGDITFSAQ